MGAFLPALGAARYRNFCIGSLIRVPLGAGSRDSAPLFSNLPNLSHAVSCLISVLLIPGNRRSVSASWVVSRSLFRRASNLGGDGFVFRPSLPRCPRQAVAAARAKARTPAYGSRGLWRRRREPPWLSEAQPRVRPVSASSHGGRRES